MDGEGVDGERGEYEDGCEDVEQVGLTGDRAGQVALNGELRE